MTTMMAYHGDPAIKRRYLRRVRAHARADQIVQGYGYWKDGKGCAVGCTVHGDGHTAYETEIGVPQAIAWLEDAIFEGLPVERARQWPAEFLSAIPVGADLSRVTARFLLAVQQRQLAALDAPGRALVGPALERVIGVLAAWAETGTATAAAGATMSARAAAASAEWSARAARAATAAAWASGAWAAWAARAAAVSGEWTARAAARSGEHEWQASTLVALLREAR